MFKKIRLIITLALVLTIGGVYAQFNYAQQNAAESGANLSTNLAAAVTSGLKGTINIANTVSLRIDDNNNDLVTELVHTGDLKVSFTPTIGADSDVTANGIPLKMKVTITGNNTYKGQAVYVLHGLDSNNEVTLNDGNPVKNEISVDLANYINVSAISLPTHDDYLAFSTVHQGIVIQVTISEATTTAA